MKENKEVSTEEDYEALFQEITDSVPPELATEEPEESETPEKEDPVIEDTPEEKEPEAEADAETEEVSEDKSEETEGQEPEVSMADLTQQLKMAEHKHRSDTGRLSALQRKVEKLQNELEDRNSVNTELSAKLEKLSTVKPDPQVEETADLKALKEEGLDKIAAAIKSQSDEALKAAQAVTEPQAPESPAPASKESTTSDQEDEKWVEEQRQAVLDVFPNIEQITKNKFFKEFLDQAPPGVQNMARSMHAEDVITLVESHYAPYYFDMFPEERPDNRQDVASTSTESSEGEESGEPSDKALAAKERREASLKDTSPAKGARPRNAQSEEDLSSTEAYERLFNKVAEAM